VANLLSFKLALERDQYTNRMPSAFRWLSALFTKKTEGLCKSWSIEQELIGVFCVTGESEAFCVDVYSSVDDRL
jgi:hypothetical protein